MRLDTKKTSQLFDLLFVGGIRCKLFDSAVESFDFWFLLLIRCHVFIQCLTIQIRKIECFQPFPVLDGPFMTIIEMPVAKTERINLLLDFFKHQFMIIPHPEILFYCIVFFIRYMYRVISTIWKTLRNHERIPLVCLDPFALRCQHCCRSKNSAFDTGIRQLMIQGIAEAPGLITALNRIGVRGTQFVFQLVNKLNYIFVIRCYLDVGKDSVFAVKHRFHRT